MRRGLVHTVLVVTALAVVAGGCSGGDEDAAEGQPGWIADCEPREPAGWSRARVWNETLLDAVRLDVPSPTVHARTLFHTSAAMWDAWAGYDATARGVFVDEELGAQDVRSARETALSFAAYRVLVHRFLLSEGAEESVTAFDDLMAELCLDSSYEDTAGDDPAAFGNRIAEKIIEGTVDDGSDEANGYEDPSYEPVNPPLVVEEPGTTMTDPNRWQPLELEVMVAQNGVPLDETVQTFVGSQWGAVTPFALTPSDGTPPALDPGPPPVADDPATGAEFRAAAVEVVAHSSLLDPASGATIDISPAVAGNTPLGTYDARGHERNPVTGEPYEPNVVPLGDYGRVVAEFWADGPSSETPPGHWNTIANSVTDSLGEELRIAGEGQVVDELEWDVKLYLALNGAMHDAAVAAWGAKRHYDYARPISMIRHLGALGQSSDPSLPGYHPDGLPLVPGLVEVVSADSAAAGQRHEALAEHVGEVAVRSWLGAPSDPENETGGVGWELAVDWVPYQLPTFVTPAFAAYVSGHSTFSRAGAEVLTSITGSEYFPGGLAEWEVEPGALEFEAGPGRPVTLQWATFTDAADEAGRSRLYGGIHVRADDLRGREVGLRAGRGAWELARRHFDGTVEN